MNLYRNNYIVFLGIGILFWLLTIPCIWLDKGQVSSQVNHCER